MEYIKILENSQSDRYQEMSETDNVLRERLIGKGKMLLRGKS